MYNTQQAKPKKMLISGMGEDVANLPEASRVPLVIGLGLFVVAYVVFLPTLAKKK